MSDEDLVVRPRTIGRSGLAVQAYEALREQILDQTIAPGVRINIDQLAAELGVSSSPIREALARLLSERLVSFEPYIGYSAATIPDDVWFHDMVDFRAMLEGNAAAIGAPRRDRATIVTLEQAFDEMSNSGLGHHYRKYRRFNAADAIFHRAIVASPGNKVFTQVYADLQPHVHYARLYLSRGVEEEAGGRRPASGDPRRVPERRRSAARARSSPIWNRSSSPAAGSIADVRAKVPDPGRPKKR